MNQSPKLPDNSRKDPIFAKIRKMVLEEKWVKDADVRFRQEGHVYFGEIFIIPSSEEDITSRIEGLRKKVDNMNWRIFDVTITLVPRLD